MSWVHAGCKPDTLLITVWKEPISRLECVLIIMIGSSFITDRPRSPETHAASEESQVRDTQTDLSEGQWRSLLQPSIPPNIIPLQTLNGRSRVVGVLVYADWNAPLFFVAFLAEL